MTSSVERLAAELTKFSLRPEYVGKTWTWESIATVLDCSVGRAHQVIYYLRQNAHDRWWTVGTFSTGYTMVPTTSLIDALDDTINQYTHARTRAFTQHRKMLTLSNVDPDPRNARVASREARFWRRQVEDITEHLEALMELRDDGGASQPVVAPSA